MSARRSVADAASGLAAVGVGVGVGSVSVVTPGNPFEARARPVVVRGGRSVEDNTKWNQARSVLFRKSYQLSAFLGTRRAVGVQVAKVQSARSARGC
jgi:hypothetical protein